VRTYVLKRLLLIVPTLVGITLLTYAIVRLAPGDPVEALIRAKAGDINPQVFAKEAHRIRERLGLLDHNLWGDDPEEQIARLAGGDADAPRELMRMTHIRPTRVPEVWRMWWEDRRPRTLLQRLTGAHARKAEVAKPLAAMTGKDFGVDVGRWWDWWEANRDEIRDRVAEKVEAAVERLDAAREALARAPKEKEDEADHERARKRLAEAHEDLKRLTGMDLPPDPDAWRRWWRANRPADLVQRMVRAEAEAEVAAVGLAHWAGENLGTEPPPWQTWWEQYQPTFQQVHEEPFQEMLAGLRTARDRYDDLCRRRDQQGPGAADDSADPAALQAARRDLREAAEALVAQAGTDIDTSPRAWSLWWEENRFHLRDDYIDPGERVVSVFIGYGEWVRHMAHGDFGESVQYRTKAGSKAPFDLYKERAAVTVTLNLIAESLIFLIAIPVGLMAARYQGRLFDRGSTIALLGLWSVPQVLAGTLLLSLLARGGRGLQWFPITGLHESGSEALAWGPWFLDTLWHATLPVLCLVYGGLAYLAKLGRASLLENLRADYVRTARAKGLPESRVVYYHALRNSLLPMITTMVMMLPVLLGGSVIVERIFTLPGMGDLVVGAAMQRDLAVIMFGTLVFGTLTLLALLAGDVLYAWADPRVRYE